MALASSLSGRRSHLSTRQSQDAPSTLLGFFPAHPTPTVPSGPAAHVHHRDDPYPYAMVSPASLTHDFDQSPSSCYRRESPPHFTRPLSMSVLNDPAFSSDPRVHPHFSHINASFYKELPSKSPVMIVNDLPHTPPDTPSDHHQVLPVQNLAFVSHSPESHDHPSSASTSTCVSLDSDSHTVFSAFTSPTVSSATSHSHSQTHTKTPRVPSPLKFAPPFTTSSVSASPCHDPRSSPAMSPPTSDRPIPKRNASAPEKHVKQVKPPTVRFQTTPAHADGSNRPEGKRRIKDFMRRLTNSRALDRIDEIEEADPLGAGRHYADPFEAVGSNLARLGPAHMYNDIDILRGDFYSKFTRENIHRPLRTQKSGANGPKSQSVVPGQIFRHSPTSDMIAPSPHITQPNAVNDVSSHRPGLSQTKPSHSHSPPRYSMPEGVPPSYTSLHAPASRSSPPRFGDDVPLYPQPAHDELAPYPQTIHVLPPDHHEHHPEIVSSSRGDANRGPLSSLPIVEPTGGQRIHFPRHRSTHSADSSRTHTTRTTQSTSHTQNSFQPPRNHHLPKRLVMPAPLQQQQEPLYPRAYSYDEYADLDLFPPTDSRTHDTPAMYSQGRKVLRKKTAVFPGNVPLPTHAPVAIADAILPLTKHPSMTADTSKVKEEVRRRRLSKRKYDA
ncbi:hypothetical protein K503DRAFT_852674 [Rhizopogon vinicolor AM-OR11-026]|uniref:Pal1-domain-containing protein n=1 Tax=Rhizopogon vinicolor AM-OR11-026 TaxID=1314800 RepID=A0A1B7NI51_9AGAM|nr:hypothetical protein K503DRAFT_852674 [Rhizopogon vinicolor AM-OR11-026]